jgi:phage terminase small subunit
MLKNARHEKFCQNVVKGATFGDAYMAAGYKAKPDPAAKAGSRLAKTPKVKARIAELKKAQSDKAEMTRDEMRRYLIEVMRTPAGHINREHELCQSWKETDDSTEVKMPDKLKAAAELIRLCGWAEPDKVHVEAGDKLAALLQRIRK